MCAESKRPLYQDAGIVIAFVTVGMNAHHGRWLVRPSMLGIV
ncbi:MAG: hypothetical protein Q7T88_06025 [Methylotenera sp.]|nr:hypothetical protein [Methylotenera sp.]